MNPEYQNYIDSLTKEELLKERTSINIRLYSAPKPSTSPQQREQNRKEVQELVEKKQYIRRRLLYLTSGDLLNSLAPVIKNPLPNNPPIPFN